eukprot:ANDGO_08517.mRNA.1 hypothetical protein
MAAPLDNETWIVRQLVNACHLRYDACISKKGADPCAFVVTFSKPTAIKPIPESVTNVHCELFVQEYGSSVMNFVHENQFSTFTMRFDVENGSSVSNVHGDMIRDEMLDHIVDQKVHLREHFKSLVR